MQMFATQLINAAEPPPATLDDISLVQAARADMMAFAGLYQRYATQVYRYLLVRVGSVPEAQDLTSQTFMAAMQGLKSYRGQQPFPAWLLGIARHKAADLYRRQQPDVGLEMAEDMAADADGNLEDAVSRQLVLEQVARKMQTLAPDRAEALTLRLFGGLEVPEIAQIMDRNEAAVRMLVFRGLRDLQAQLNVVWEDES
ncbi:MAG: hypothetical protein Fur0021_37250 [Candidatus Promineifilaceae bacterium]